MAGVGLDAAGVARAYVALLDAREWDAWAALLHADVVYELPQSRERIRGRAAYRAFNETFPGQWRLEAVSVIGEGRRAFARCVARVDGEEADALVLLDLDEAGLIVGVTDFWPEAYDPPPRAVPLERW